MTSESSTMQPFRASAANEVLPLFVDEGGPRATAGAGPLGHVHRPAPIPINRILLNINPFNNNGIQVFHT